MSRDGLLPIKVEIDPTDSLETAYAGTMVYFDLWNKLRMQQKIDEIVHICGAQGWMDRQIITAILLINLIGGDCVSDVDKLEADPGLCAMFRSSELEGFNREQRRAIARRFRRGRGRTLPAPTQLSAALERCHNEEEESRRIPGKAFIPKPNEHLLSIADLNTALVEIIQRLKPEKIATLDGDATIVEAQNHNALYSYKGIQGYQPYNVFWFEQQLVAHSEFRDGNVPAGHEVTRVMKEAIARLPQGVERVYTRQDTAAYQTDFLAWCEREDEHPQFGRILFTVSSDVTQAFKQAVLQAADWTKEYRGLGSKRKETGREYAEIVYVPNSHAVLTGIPEPFRYIAVREKMGDQLSLLDGDEPEGLPFPTITMKGVRYKLHGIVTNRRDEPAEELIRWHYERCGKSEEAHSIMKTDFAGGQMPSAEFGANAAWWLLMILATNFQMAMKRLVLGPRWEKSRMKAIRFNLINVVGRIVNHSRQLFIRVSRHMHDWVVALRMTVARLTPLLE